MSYESYQGQYQGEKAVWLRAGHYEAAVLPEIGANLIAFRDTEKGYKFLHEPTSTEEMASFVSRPMVHGIPVLFPPNRFEDGKFPWEGRTYEFPINESNRNNHLHGFVYNIPWEVQDFGAGKLNSWVTLVQQVRPGHSAYEYFPHSFTIILTYTLSEAGLHQSVTVRNDGTDVMPCLLAMHTSVNAPFAQSSTAEDCSFMMTIGERYEMNERMLPTGHYQALGAEEAKIKSGGVSPYFEAMDNHYTAVPQNGRNRMELTDSREGVKLIYDVGTSYKHWMVYNNNAQVGFFCPEPQTNLVNAPNVDLPAEQIGLFSLLPGELWEESSRLYCISIK